MHEAIFTLRQETPIIHFLHDQPGATLRATELKPKLDSWLKAKIADIPDAWVSVTNDKGHTSYDYKISILPAGRGHDVILREELGRPDRQSGIQKWETPAYPHLLSNMGGKEYREELKNLVLYDGAEIVVKTWHEDLLDKIKIHLPQLLANTNFGNRSGKGFGSFTCTTVGDGPQRTKPNLPYCFDWKVKEGNVAEQQKHLFSAINWFYKCLRSGINQVNRNGETEFYFKSLMFAFAKQEKNERWDKYTIKNYFFTGGDLPDKADYRDWLGLSTEEMWGKRYNNQKITKEGSEGVERFASPILFKPVRTSAGNQYKVYFGVLADQEEVFSKFSQATIQVNLNGKQLQLKPAANFSFDQFFKFAFEDTDIEEHLLAFDRDNLNDTRYWIYRDFIHPIFSSIRQNHRQNV